MNYIQDCPSLPSPSNLIHILIHDGSSLLPPSILDEILNFWLSLSFLWHSIFILFLIPLLLIILNDKLYALDSSPPN
jgi:hypothetical protein